MTDNCQVFCGKQAVHTHHRKMRSQGGGDEPSNLMRVCMDCHNWIHANPSEAYARGLLVHSWADPAEVTVYTYGQERGEQGDDEVEFSPEEEAAHREAVGAIAAEHGFPLSDWTPTIPNRDAEHPVGEGEVCPTCERRKPHKKKEGSPTSKVWSTRIPIDDAQTFSELVDAAAEHHGLTSKPFFRYWCLTYALVLLLQAEPGELPA